MGESPLSNWLACSLHARVWGCHGVEVPLGVTTCCMQLVEQAVLTVICHSRGAWGKAGVTEAQEVSA